MLAFLTAGCSCSGICEASPDTGATIETLAAAAHEDVQHALPELVQAVDGRGSGGADDEAAAGASESSVQGGERPLSEVAARRRPHPLEGLEVEKMTTLTTETPGHEGSVGFSHGGLTTPLSPEAGRCLKSQRSQSLQEETMCSILGDAPRKEPPAPSRGGPMLLGRTTLSPVAASSKSKTLDEVKNRAAGARKQQSLRAFLLSSGFAEVNSRKETRIGMLRKGFTFPLHTAVRANDADALEALLSGGADRAAIDSDLLTPLTLAKRLNSQGSHTKVISLLED